MTYIMKALMIVKLKKSFIDGKKIIVFFIQGINGIQKSCQMVVDASAPYKGITVGIGFYFGSVNK